MDKEGDPLGVIQITALWLDRPKIFAKSRIYPREQNTENSLGFWYSSRSPNLGQRIVLNEKNMSVDFAILEDYRVNLKESEKMDKYFNFTSSMWNMTVTVVLVI